MKKYVSILLAAILSASLLAGCGGSGKSGQQPAKEAQEQAAQPEETETEEAGAVEDGAQADAAKEDPQAAAAADKEDPQAAAAAAKDDPQTDAAADSDAYLVYVKDAETMAPMPGVNVQFCSDVLCQMGKTDENGVAAFHSDPGTYTVHLMKAPDGYVSSTEEFTLDQDNREATYFLEKQETEP
ncbi:MAG: SpaA isopeptide-forming pilin-related protein [Eubacteriales bacterium]|nr:SpaA isopeptide-forming pilin-related protein [Eubacteriales bacterium]